MNFLEKYMELLSSNPLTTLVTSVCLLALLIHVVAPLVCEVYRYYPNKITGKETVKNAYLERVRAYEVHYYDSKLPLRDASKVFVGNRAAYETFHESSKENRHILIEEESNISISYYTAYILMVLIISVSATLLLEYLLANFFIYTLVIGLAAGVHFAVIFFGKKVYKISEDVKTLKEKQEDGDAQ